MMRLLEVLEDLDDTQNVYTNFDMDEATMAETRARCWRRSFLERPPERRRLSSVRVSDCRNETEIGFRRMIVSPLAFALVMSAGIAAAQSSPLDTSAAGTLPIGGGPVNIVVTNPVKQERRP